MIPQKAVLFTIAGLFVLGTGCGLRQRQSLEQQDFLLNVEFNSSPSTAPTETCFKTRPCRTASSFASRQLVYRTGEVEYETDFYNRLLVPASENIDELLNTWIHHQGYMQCADGLSQEHYLLIPHLHEFYGDFRNDGKGAAVVTMQWYLIHEDPSCNCSKTILNKMYEAKAELNENTPGNLVKAHSQALRDIFAELEQDLKKTPL